MAEIVEIIDYLEGPATFGGKIAKVSFVKRQIRTCDLSFSSSFAGIRREFVEKE